MEYTINIEDPRESGLPGLARENLAKMIGWDSVRELFPHDYEK